MNVVQRVLSQRVVGYNFTSQYGESVVASVCLMSDGTEQTQYDRQRRYRSGVTAIHEYGERCPRVQAQQQQEAA
jgi:hypothetical protein